MTADAWIDAPLAPRHQRLSEATDAQHEELHGAVAALAPFASRENFARFVAVQYRFQSEIEALYRRPELQALLPGLAQSGRLAAAAADLDDLGVARPVIDAGRTVSPGFFQALGWLFVSEGSTLGAAVLLKRAQALGLSENFGARHLAGAPEGRARHWRAFVSVLDGLQLDETEDAAVMQGAQSAFARFHELLRQAL
jgi:heme oxygenase